jgi:predicted nucleic acid-binding protein
VIVVDTSVVYALIDRADNWHGRVADWYRTADPDMATTPLVLAEVDHLVAARAGSSARTSWRRDLAAGAYAVHWWARAPRDAVAVAERYADLGVDLTDASLAVLASRLRTAEVATLDERHFRALRPLSGEDAFRLLPLDA